MSSNFTVHRKKEDSIDFLIKRYPAFSAFKDTNVFPDSISGIERDLEWGYLENGSQKKLIKDLQTMFIGQTGYGKSTLLNAILGEYVFKTDDVESCTKELQNAFFWCDSKRNTYLSLKDFPGIGESEIADAKYMEWYKEMLIKSSCIVYVLNADKRSHTPDFKVFKELFEGNAMKNRVVIALTCADKVGNNRSEGITTEQLEILSRKVDEIKILFGDLPIIPCSGKTGWNVDKLVDAMVKMLKKDTFTVNIHISDSDIEAINGFFKAIFGWK